ncbi:ATPase [Candidatus Dojkabacteria bacterium]|uniref:ATPase n=1 Tax=Candidatus Dojkabacteria bacterium TaxID=2099670 RepID=A0A955L744_9BACT|nr:ATPase [Candidatus Dojkabacteria bacterium]
MAQKSIREYHAKQLISQNLPTGSTTWHFSGALVSEHETLGEIPDGPLIVKSDQLFGKRGKNGLIYKAKDKKDALTWIDKHMNAKTIIKKNENDEGVEGILTHFIVEPYVEHTDEYYLAIKTSRTSNTVYFSDAGGMDIEENWEQVKMIEVPFSYTDEYKLVLEKELADESIDIRTFVITIYELFIKLDFAYLEINPFAISERGVIPLDLVARLDSTAEYEQEASWIVDNIPIPFPSPFGSSESESEIAIDRLDAKTGASLKLKILNPDGRIWLLVAGGGASVIFADTVADLGFVDELGNYGEYSGNPSTDETAAYCTELFKTMFASSASNKVLIIGGGIANFTDIAATFKGVIKAIQQFKDEFIQQNIPIHVRRGGPRHKEGLAEIKKAVEAMGIPIDVNGPEMHMTRIVKNVLKK